MATRPPMTPPSSTRRRSKRGAGRPRRDGYEIETRGPPNEWCSTGTDQAALDGDDGEVEDDADEGDRQQRCEHERRVEQGPTGKVDQDTEPAFRTRPLADDRAHDRERHADAEAAEDVRHRSRDLERQQDLAACRSQASAQLEEA